MTFWFFSGLVIFSAVVATLARSLRIAGFSLWICGLGVGGIYLSLGAEFIAIFQWIVATLTGLMFVFYSILLGGREQSISWTKFLLVVGLGVTFLWITWLCVQTVPAWESPLFKSEGLVALGERLIQEHLLPLEILAITLFLTIVGSGVIARPESDDDRMDKKEKRVLT